MTTTYVGLLDEIQRHQGTLRFDVARCRQANKGEPSHLERAFMEELADTLGEIARSFTEFASEQESRATR